MNIQQFFKRFPDDETCLNHLFEVRFGQGHTCSRCGKSGGWHRIKAERAYSCQWCGNHLHPTVGTPFEKSRTSLQLWFYTIYLFAKSRNGVSAKELERQLGVTYKTAWRMGHEIRKHMANLDSNSGPLSGDVEIDETMVGGKRSGKRGRGAAGKTNVFGMVERGGNIKTKIIKDFKGDTIKPIIRDNVDKDDTTIYSDKMNSYKGLGKDGYDHKTVNHSKKEFAKGNTHVNTLEGYWRILKASIAGTHIWVSGKHLDKYTAEFGYRFNRRQTPDQMLPELLSRFPEKQED